MVLLTSLLTLGLLGMAGCGNRKPPTSSGARAHGFFAAPPHGGTPVVLGDEDYQVEFVLDAPAGKLIAYVLDGEMENFVRITPSAFDVTAQRPGGPQVLHFVAVANSATGETVGSTSQFEAQADWLQTAKTFDGVILEINVAGTAFKGVVFNFPKGNAVHENNEK
jgi:hypothetical protein